MPIWCLFSCSLVVCVCLLVFDLCTYFVSFLGYFCCFIVICVCCVIDLFVQLFVCTCLLVLNFVLPGDVVCFIACGCYGVCFGGLGVCC